MDPPSSTVNTFKYNRSSSNPEFEDVSFSSYIKSNDPLRKSLEKDQNDTEINIFDAQKYFSDTKHDLEPIKPPATATATAPFHAATPTASSEASWNSQTGLLVANATGPTRVSITRFRSEKIKGNDSATKKWSFGRKCCCSGKKSVQVKEVTSDSDNGGQSTVIGRNYSQKVKSPACKIRAQNNPLLMSPEKSFPSSDSGRQHRVSASGRAFVDVGGGAFSFPILNPSSQATILKSKSMIEDPPRDSLEVFQPTQSISNIPIVRDEDICSDASSDLFEIESFSTQTTPYPMMSRGRDSLDEAQAFNARRFAAANGLNLNGGRRSLDEPPTPSVAATECYPPSEVSIDWSVTTAEGFDKASVSNISVSASEIGSAAIFRQRFAQEEVTSNDDGRKKGNGSGGGGLLLMSCRHDKAVSVGPQPVKCTVADDLKKFPVHAGSSRPPRANKPPAGNSHRLSLAFAA